jgi:hypothetical protein
MASSQDAPVAELAQLQLAVRKTEAELRELREAEANATKLAVEAEKVRLRNTAREELKKMHDILAVSQLHAERSGMTVQEYFPELQAMELKVKTRELVIVLNYLYETDPEFAYSLIHCVASTQSSDATCAGSEQRGEVPLMHSLLEAMNPDLFAFLVNEIICIIFFEQGCMSFHSHCRTAIHFYYIDKKSVHVIVKCRFSRKSYGCCLCCNIIYRTAKNLDVS